jgi:hypothetical protein
MGRFLTWWHARSKKAQIGMAVGTVRAFFILLAAIIPSSDNGDKKAASSPPPPATQPPPPAEAQPPPPPPPVPKTTPPILHVGYGAKVETIRLTASGPIVVQARHRGDSNFAVELVGAHSSELLVNEIGNYKGAVAYADATAGRYRLKITADGAWAVIVSQPFPQEPSRLVPGTFSGFHSRVVRIRAEDDLQPIVTVRHRGQSNFVVELIGYGDTSGDELLVNEIGNYSGQTLLDSMPEGSYLLAVTADGPWTVKFTL